MTLSTQDLATLIAAGVPIAGDEQGIAFAGFASLVPILKNILEGTQEVKLRDAIRGWLIALRDHYPPTFQKHFQCEPFLTLLSGPIEGRDIKLRRIALSHLAKIA